MPIKMDVPAKRFPGARLAPLRALRLSFLLPALLSSAAFRRPLRDECSIAPEKCIRSFSRVYTHALLARHVTPVLRPVLPVSFLFARARARGILLRSFVYTVHTLLSQCEEEPCRDVYFSRGYFRRDSQPVLARCVLQTSPVIPRETIKSNVGHPS